MVLRLCGGLLLPLSAQNALLLAAGFAPAFPVSPLQSDALGPFRLVLDQMIARHDPNPALLVDRHWNVREANTTARLLLSQLQDGDEEVNLARLLVDSERAQGAIANFPEVLHEITARLQLEALEAGGDPILTQLVTMLERACVSHPLASARVRRPVLPLELDMAGARWRFLSVIAHFGTSEDATIRDLRLELLFPADAETRAAIKALAERQP